MGDKSREEILIRDRIFAWFSCDLPETAYRMPGESKVTAQQGNGTTLWPGDRI